MKKKGPFIILSIFLVLLISCQEETYQLCPDNVTNVIDINDCPEPIPTCPICDDNNNCTMDSCSALTDYECEFEEIAPCDGNKECEEGEFPWSTDCPNECNDNDECTIDSFNYLSDKCNYEEIMPCCSNSECESGETYVNCPFDCKQLLDIKDIKYTKTRRIAGAYNDLTGTDFIYLVVTFKIHNMGIDEKEVIDYETKQGFYYDPFKTRLEASSGNFYDVEYDSDLLDEWSEAMVLPKGHTKSAAAAFIIPTGIEHIRVIAYDKYGAQLDVDEIY